MCIRDRPKVARTAGHLFGRMQRYVSEVKADINREVDASEPVSYTHLRAHETVLDLVCRLLLEKKKDE